MNPEQPIPSPYHRQPGPHDQFMNEFKMLCSKFNVAEAFVCYNKELSGTINSWEGYSNTLSADLINYLNRTSSLMLSEFVKFNESKNSKDAPEEGKDFL